MSGTTATGRRVGAAVAGVVVVAGYAALAGLWVSRGQAWYDGLRQPAWQPPDAVFGIIWPYNFLALAAVSVVVAWRGEPVRVAAWLAVLVANVATALAWAYTFYVPHALGLSAVALVGSALLALGLVVLAWPVAWPAGAVLVPYAVWVALASSLAVGYWRLDGG